VVEWFRVEGLVVEWLSGLLVEGWGLRVQWFIGRVVEWLSG